jgi:hypothetical protein
MQCFPGQINNPSTLFAKASIIQVPGGPALECWPAPCVNHITLPSKIQIGIVFK